MKKIVTRAIIPAAGMGRRMKTMINKPYLNLKGKPILAHTLDVFEGCDMIAEIILVINKNEFNLCQEEILTSYKFKKVRLIEGGETRQESVYQGLQALDEKTTDLVMVHDGARPLLKESIIRASILETSKCKATTVGVASKNTIKVINKDGIVDYTPNRDRLIEIQTPQTFAIQLLRKAHQKARDEGIMGTDDAFLVEALSYPIKIVSGDYSNIKITTPEDLMIAEAMMEYLEKN